MTNIIYMLLGISLNWHNRWREIEKLNYLTLQSSKCYILLRFVIYIYIWYNEHTLRTICGGLNWSKWVACILYKGGLL